MSGLFEVALIQGTITFTDGETVEFGLGPDVDWRSGNATQNLGRAVDVCEAIRDGVLEAIRDGVQDAELWDDGMVDCPNCGDRVDEGQMNYWPDLDPPVSMCDPCEHNARRSGWEPGR
jgi:hypothetical protein